MIDTNVASKRLSVFLVLSFIFSLPSFARENKALEEVIVTAQKRQESLQDVSAAVTAFDDDSLTRNQVNNVLDMQGMVPNVNIGNSQGQAHIFIRGIGLDQVFTGGDPSVAVHVDGAVMAQPQVQLSSFFDLERVEVLRGPQGTLYGRNSTGGSINFITKKPTNETEGYGRVTYGNYDNLIFEGALGGALVDNKLLGRVAFKTENRDGYGDNIVTNKEIDDADKVSFRGQLKYIVNDDVDFTLSGEYHEEDDSAYGFHYLSTQRTDIGLPPPLLGANIASDVRDVASDVDYKNLRETWALTGTLNWQLNEQFRITSITNYRTAETESFHDLDATSIPFFGQNLLFEDDQLSEELQLHYEEEKLRGLVGFFYFDEEMSGYNRAGPLPTGTAAFNFVNFDGVVDVEAWALFAQFEYDINDMFTLNFGARYSDEDRQGTSLATGIVFPPGGLPNVTGDGVTDFSPRVGLDWHINEDMMAYFSYSQAFKAGVIQVGTLEPIVQPEEIESFEIGFKGSFFDNSVIVNAAAFYYDFSNLQVSRTLPSAPGAPVGTEITVFENAGAAENKGVEVEISWQATDALRLDGNLGYLDAEYKEYISIDPVFPERGLQSLAGNVLPQAPEWTWNLSGQYDLALQNGAILTFGANAAYSSEIFFSGFEYARGGQDAVTLLNTNVTYTSADEKYYVNLWVRNLTDELVRATTFPIPLSVSNVATFTPPRTYGLSFGYNF